jgi:flavodoxin
MKRLFIYFSLTGNCDLVAEHLKEKGFETRKVEMKKPLPKSFFFSVMTGGFLAGMGVKSKLKDYDHNIEGYDEIVIGSPIWNGRFSSPLNRLLKEIDFKGKNVKFVFTAGSGEGKHALKKANKLYPGAECIFLKEPKKYKEELDKLSA